MCLIAYVPEGTSIPRETFDYAAARNRDGFGVMSVRGVERFFGRKAKKRARRYSAELSAANVAHAVHWRYATHGAPSIELCHPFALPNGKGYVMHNGVLGAPWTERATKTESDTLLYVRSLVDAPEKCGGKDSAYWGRVQEDIGYGNKFVVLMTDGTFCILNEKSGLWRDKVWYSNSYSLPDTFDWQTWEREHRSQVTRPDSGYADWWQRELDGQAALNYSGDSYYGTYAPGKRFNPVTGRWEWPGTRKIRDNARLLEHEPEGKPALPSGPTLDPDTKDNCHLARSYIDTLGHLAHSDGLACPLVERRIACHACGYSIQEARYIGVAEYIEHLQECAHA